MITYSNILCYNDKYKKLGDVYEFFRVYFEDRLLLPQERKSFQSK